jgi:hypothetical protein
MTGVPSANTDRPMLASELGVSGELDLLPLP